MAIACFVLMVEGVTISPSKKCDPMLCQRVRCYNVEETVCNKQSEIFVRRDGICHCCDACVSKEKKLDPQFG
ncbi:hypothetical protein HHI36_011135 [Cryptolaemus montrouzieri]|uniref:Uncharacterized protein n=1 Tax=Cryptolaemus montrouzieri TaxID=559131 RepID=A0ABD2MKX2_9CUCU